MTKKIVRKLLLTTASLADRSTTALGKNAGTIVLALIAVSIAVTCYVSGDARIVALAAAPFVALAAIALGFLAILMFMCVAFVLSVIIEAALKKIPVS